MGMYESHSYRVFEITKEQYNYMLPIQHIKDRMEERSGKYFYIGNKYMYEDFLERCKYL